MVEKSEEFSVGFDVGWFLWPTPNVFGTALDRGMTRAIMARYGQLGVTRSNTMTHHPEGILVAQNEILVRWKGEEQRATRGGNM